MAKLKNLKGVAKGNWAVKSVSFRLANVAEEGPEPGVPTSGAPVIREVGVRVLSGEETAWVYERAYSLAKSKGVEKWDAEHPLCILYERVCTLAIACTDVDSPPGKKPEPFFENVEEVLESELIGQDNIVYLYERWLTWVDECSFEKGTMTAEEVLGIALAHAQSPEGSDGPLVRMRPGLRESYSRTLAVLLSSCLSGKLPSGVLAESSSSAT